MDPIYAHDFDAEFEAELDRALIGGREERDIVIVDYSVDWPRRFEAERERIARALGPVASSIEHIGSTAVPGLAAKPVVDIQVTVDDVDDENAFVPAMEEAGYVLRVREPGHRMFRTPDRDVHVHFWRARSEEAGRDIAFRDWLRAHPEDRTRYERTKRELVGHYRDGNYYARAKTPVIEEIMKRATAGN